MLHKFGILELSRVQHTTHNLASPAGLAIGPLTEHTASTSELIRKQIDSHRALQMCVHTLTRSNYLRES